MNYVLYTILENMPLLKFQTTGEEMVNWRFTILPLEAEQMSKQNEEWLNGLAHHDSSVDKERLEIAHKYSQTVDPHEET